MVVVICKSQDTRNLYVTILRVLVSRFAGSRSRLQSSRVRFQGSWCQGPVSQGPRPLMKMSNILNLFRKDTLFKSFIMGQFNYCPLLWMISSHSSNNLINKIHERALSLISEINDIPFNELLSNNNEVSTYNKNIQTSLIEVYTNLNGLSPPKMLGLLTAQDNRYDLRIFESFIVKKRKPFNVALRLSHIRQLSYRNYYRMILKTLQII